MAFDVAAFSAPVSPESPAGENLEYDPLYLKLEELAAGVPAKQMGDSVVAGEEPNWIELKNACVDLFGKTRDFRVAVYLTLSGLRTGGVEEMRDGLLVIKNIIDKLWDSAWPRLDPDDGNDPTERMNVLSSLSPLPGAYQDPVMFLQRLRSVPLCDSRQMGRFALRDILIAGGDIAAPEGQPPTDMSIINAAFLDTDQATLKSKNDAITESIQIVGEISKLLNEKVGADRAASFAALLADLKKIGATIQQHLQQAASSDAAATQELAAADGGATATAAPSLQASAAHGEIRTRDDALAVLEKICKFYELTEPNSPVPYFLRRAIRVAKMDFIALLQEINPDAVVQAKNILGAKDLPTQQ